MKKITLFTSFIIFLCFSACTQKHNISANIAGMQNDTVYVIYSSLSYLNDNIDTLISDESNFVYDVKEPTLLYFIPKKYLVKEKSGGYYAPRSKMFFAFVKPNEEINIIGKMHKSFVEYESKGSLINESEYKFRKSIIGLMQSEESLDLQIDLFSSLGKDTAEINSLRRESYKISREISNKKLQFIRNNLDNDLSAFYLFNQNLDTIVKYYDLLSDRVKSGTFKEPLNNFINKHNEYQESKNNSYNIAIGKIAPDFKLKTLDNINYGLSYILPFGELYDEVKTEENEYIVLDFWGTWCGPCIAGISRMKTYKEKYIDRLALISIACNEKDYASWEKFIKKNELDNIDSWFQLYDNKENKVSIMYAIESFPTKIILDNRKNKEIIGIYSGETDEFYNKLDELFSL